MARKKVVQSTQHRFCLEKYSGPNSRHPCPHCKSRKSFARYVDITTGEEVASHVGKCNRVVKCAYHEAPSSEDLEGQKLFVNSNEVLTRYLERDRINLIDPKEVTRHMYEETNNFVEFLHGLFPYDKVIRILKRYRVGSVNYWGKMCPIFWQIDSDFDVRSGKIMGYGQDGGRVKGDKPEISWIHLHLRQYDFSLQQCFFGEHLVTKSKKFYFVESEKTAILCSIHNPDTYWVGVGGLEMINETRLLPFKGCELIFVPDKGAAFQKWEEKLRPFKEDFDIKLLDTLEKNTTLQEGDDMGDLIIKKYTK